MRSGIARAVHVGLAILVLSAICGCVVPDPASEARERALWQVSEGMTKSEIVRFAGEPTQIAKPNMCKDVADVTEEIVYEFEVEFRFFGRYPRTGRYICLDQAKKVVGCCGFIEY
jgi:hypothetical protein